MKLKANLNIPSTEGVKWLVIESDENDTKGFLLYCHTSEKNAFDTWYKTIEQALEAAYLQFDVTKGEWKILE